MNILPPPSDWTLIDSKEWLLTREFLYGDRTLRREGYMDGIIYILHDKPVAIDTGSQVYVCPGLKL